jgi:hypothetical protein
LSCDCYLSVILHSGGAILPVRVVKDDGDRCLCDSSLSTFIDKILLVLCTHLKKGYLSKEKVIGDDVEDAYGGHVSETENKTNSIEDI